MKMQKWRDLESPVIQSRGRALGDFEVVLETL